jgi:hypothetical protein
MFVGVSSSSDALESSYKRARDAGEVADLTFDQAYIAVPRSKCSMILRDGYRVTRRRTLPAAKTVEDALYAYSRYSRDEDAAVLSIRSIPDGVGFMAWDVDGARGYKLFTMHLAGQNLEHEDVLTVDPGNVRFTHDSIGRQFQCGRTITETAAQLRRGHISPHDITPIRVFVHRGMIWTANNRRLWAFKQAGVAAIPVVLADASEFLQRRFTTENEGLDVVVRS